MKEVSGDYAVQFNKDAIPAPSSSLSKPAAPPGPSTNFPAPPRVPHQHQTSRHGSRCRPRFHARRGRVSRRRIWKCVCQQVRRGPGAAGRVGGAQVCVVLAGAKPCTFRSSPPRHTRMHSIQGAFADAFYAFIRGFLTQEPDDLAEGKAKLKVSPPAKARVGSGRCCVLHTPTS